MLFNSLQFILFFLAFFFILFSIPVNVRKYWLLIASCYFYMVFLPVYLLVLVSVIVVDFIAGIKIARSKHNKKLWLVVSLVANLGILVFFKYFNFVNENISSLLNLFGLHYAAPLIGLLLPIGLSFHTFQAMAYTIEVYRGNQQAERNFYNYALYVFYFPQLVAGPIERPQHLLPQLKRPIGFNADNALHGLLRMAVGLFKKVVIADRLAHFVDPVFNDVAHATGLSVFIALIFFAFQLYCDFSGYTDIAIGVARIMGISLIENFRSPYFSSSITEFWTRWHMSLSGWFRDYVYTPLAIKKRNFGKWGIIYAIMISFILLGFWHGANWTFVILWTLHGLMLVAEFSTRKVRKKLRSHIAASINHLIGVIFTFSFFTFTLVFFRSKDVHDSFIAIRHLFRLSFKDSIPHVFNAGEMLFVITVILLLLYSEYAVNFNSIKRRSTLCLSACCLFLLCYLFGEFNFRQFIYFQF